MRALIAILILARTFTPLLSSALDDHRIRVQTGKVVQILPVGRGPSMMKMVRHPDGSIYLNTQSTDSSRSLVRSRDDGRTWTILPIRFSPEIPEGQHAAGFGISSDGKLWLIHQGNPRSQGGEELRYHDRQILWRPPTTVARAGRALPSTSDIFQLVVIRIPIPWARWLGVTPTSSPELTAPWRSP